MFQENRRIMQIIRDVEQHALAVRAEPPTGTFAELDEVAPDIELPLQRPLFSPPHNRTSRRVRCCKGNRTAMPMRSTIRATSIAKFCAGTCAVDERGFARADITGDEGVFPAWSERPSAYRRTRLGRAVLRGNAMSPVCGGRARRLGSTATSETHPWFSRTVAVAMANETSYVAAV
jgi:hypothetical protein